MLYMCKLWNWNRDDRCYQLQEPVTIVGTKRATKLYAESVLPTVSETRYRETWGKHPWVEVTGATKVGPKSNRHYVIRYIKERIIHKTPVNIVPSVGELGYW